MQVDERAADYIRISVRDALVRVQSALKAARIEGSGTDARRLLAASLAAETLDLLREPDRVLTEQEAGELVARVNRRLQREPVSRIIGEREFFGRTFRISPCTLDPRPCSETLIEAVLEIHGEEYGRGRKLRVLDVGTGSGCLLLTLLAELPGAYGVGTDVSAGALAVAQKNAVALGLDDRVRFHETSYLDGIAETFDLLLSNPPYIETAAIARLEPDVRLYDPLTALDGGRDGLDAYRAIAAGLVDVVPRGWSFFEVGAGQSLEVEKILLKVVGNECSGACRTWKDLGGHERCVAVETHCAA